MREKLTNFEDARCGECPYWPCPTRDMTKKFCLLEVDQLLSYQIEEIKKELLTDEETASVLKGSPYPLSPEIIVSIMRDVRRANRAQLQKIIKRLEEK